MFAIQKLETVAETKRKTYLRSPGMMWRTLATSRRHITAERIQMRLRVDYPDNLIRIRPISSIR